MMRISKQRKGREMVTTYTRAVAELNLADDEYQQAEEEEGDGHYLYMSCCRAKSSR